MVWSRTILDGIMLCLIFNLAVGLLWFLVPNSFSTMMPREIKEAAPPVEKRELMILGGTLYPMYLLILIYMIISTHLAGVTGFWHLFWTGYIEMMFVNAGDFFGLDWWLRSAVKDRLMIPGTEHCKAWETGEWMRTLAIPEHLLGWPLIVCPVVGFIVAGVSTWIY